MATMGNPSAFAARPSMQMTMPSKERLAYTRSSDDRNNVPQVERHDNEPGMRSG